MAAALQRADRLELDHMASLTENPLLPVSSEPAFSSVQATGLFANVSPGMKALERAITNVACSELPILIIGEKGTGKRTLARRLHEVSSRSRRDLAELECEQLKAEDFGTSRDIRSCSTSFEDSQVGTLILHEVSLLNRECQGKLHDLLTRRLQADDIAKNTPRLIFTTHSNLENEVRLGRYREDLYYRMSGVCLRVPPLRHRKEDITGLSESFLSKYAMLLQCPKPTLSDATARFLAEYAWPGNIRELEDATRTIAAVGDEKLALAALKASHRNSRRHSDKVTAVSLKEVSKAASQAAERELILKVLSQTRWNRKRAAGELKISYKALLYKLKQMGVHDPHKGAQ
jgi:two-component system, NtrC family, response regulator AtoC